MPTDKTGPSKPTPGHDIHDIDKRSIPHDERNSLFPWSPAKRGISLPPPTSEPTDDVGQCASGMGEAGTGVGGPARLTVSPSIQPLHTGRLPVDHTGRGGGAALLLHSDYCHTDQNGHR
jgi:hypothetical protein